MAKVPDDKFEGENMALINRTYIREIVKSCKDCIWLGTSMCHGTPTLVMNENNQIEKVTCSRRRLPGEGGDYNYG